MIVNRYTFKIFIWFWFLKWIYIDFCIDIMKFIGFIHRISKMKYTLRNKNTIFSLDSIYFRFIYEIITQQKIMILHEIYWQIENCENFILNGKFHEILEDNIYCLLYSYLWINDIVCKARILLIFVQLTQYHWHHFLLNWISKIFQKYHIVFSTVWNDYLIFFKILAFLENEYQFHYPITRALLFRT